MRYWILTATLLGCASPAEIEYGAKRHEQRAQYYESIGDYRSADEQRAAAAKQHEKASRRASYYPYYPYY
jgi:hypothetical protein